MSASPEWMMYVKSLLALVFVVGLIVLCAAFARRVGLDRRFAGAKSTTRRMKILETLYLDPRRRLVLVRLDAREHLLLLSSTGDLLVESCASGDSHD